MLSFFIYFSSCLAAMFTFEAIIVALNMYFEAKRSRRRFKRNKPCREMKVENYTIRR